MERTTNLIVVKNTKIRTHAELMGQIACGSKTNVCNNRNINATTFQGTTYYDKTTH